MPRKTHVETQTVERVATVIDEITCDWCKSKLPLGYEQDGYDRREFSLEFSEGPHYPDGTWSSTGWKVEDLCDACVAKLKALLIAQGITVADTEEDNYG